MAQSSTLKMSSENGVDHLFHHFSQVIKYLAYLIFLMPKGTLIVVKVFDIALLNTYSWAS